jgi:hypothetical protein
MATHETDISKALDTRLSIMAGLPAVAWENTEYEPVHGTTWLRPTLLPALTRAGTTTTDRHEGIYQISVFVKPGTGKAVINALVDAIADHFKPTTELTSGSVTVRCISVSALGARREDAWYHIPVEVRYNAMTPNR